LVRQARARREAAPDVPMVLSLEWLTADRSSVVGGEAQAPWAPERLEAFATACRQLAAAVRPEHFDVAPEVNVFLTRQPGRRDAVLQLVQRARQAIPGVSPGTKVLVSFNAEVLSGRYGRGMYLPFGKLPAPRPEEREGLRSLIDQVDEVGLTSWPQAAHTRGLELPGDHLLAVRMALGDKPLLITKLAVWYDEQRPARAFEQTAFLKRFFQTCYWLDALVVAYPDLVTDAMSGELALRVGGQARPALAVWQDVLSWKRVERLSALEQEDDRRPTTDD
jgi:hypothetical protein